ncbi:putative lipid II flippase FtsW [Rathayibacter sp. AY1G1]|jgi:cell division protein FtsW|uniref:putative lipid II flippase FtsW n=1 Tax=unclassified Rathayibacter TaxID=2609250 RepID=UPI000CE8C95A|nr:MULTISPECIES: putative lipid II flippase FtsW [unclassified Rathayibacter]PPF17452.1 putative lipid II flippase FtsW [Rathayibacter sp. AY1A4]PPF19338.1 putative lipid II flippase FtsW [Rathayibacter sp. AY1A7]PPF27337.1 putative lipid II flippase FtsW [Rathayibacter sp. AY1F2]PPF35884.1 putative lipid II flippase FtsW [Rathayibacter sp. AY1A3]PPF50213.1 putative lipid II flippase FtsW [Rathayibacter sp. AY1A1]
MTAPTTSRPAGRSRTEPRGKDRSGARSARIVLSKVFASHSPNFYLLFGTTLFLVLFGLTMVLSSSSVTSYVSSDDSFGGFLRQGGFALLGIPMMLVVSRLPLGVWKRVTPILLIAGCVLQCLVLFTPLGDSVGGNRNWIRLGAFSMQPSEIIKLALALWLGLLLARRYRSPKDWKDALIPVLIVGGAAIGLVLIGGDLGTVVIMAGIVLAALFYANVQMKVLVPIVVVGAIGAVLFAVSSDNRLTRIMSFLGDCSNVEEYQNSCWQPVHGTWAMASGGIFGVGLGNSKAKWSWLPAADNDYIFAIIGEELGLIGAIVVLALFVVLAVAFFRVIHASSDPFVRISTGAIMVWLIGQAFVNIGVVLGVLPVLGVPLPLISSGGTALLSSLLAIGVVLSFARTQTAPLPGAGVLRRRKAAAE